MSGVYGGSSWEEMDRGFHRFQIFHNVLCLLLEATGLFTFISMAVFFIDEDGLSCSINGWWTVTLALLTVALLLAVGNAILCAGVYHITQIRKSWKALHERN